ncbi:ferric reductase-like transmembrane domain-containing protein [Actinomadura rugatobispora]|uniref:Ferric reductase-like transmembrane domain-containing protein n=1 Tax=Actinomadura rugatobispora TaxID=1994 RepID=A0ABW0ZT07_9ACTN|nr:hypothetical protein GCM10010200_009360 [Actinomadura rugatobispora]
MAHRAEGTRPRSRGVHAAPPPAERGGGAVRWAGLAFAAALVAVPVAAVVASPLQEGRSFTWTLASVTGVVALALLIMQITLPNRTRLLARVFGARPLRLHRAVGLAVTGLVAAHIALLYANGPDDITDALVLDAPTYSRLGVVSAFCLALSVVLALGRRRLGLHYSNWRILHAALAVAITGTAFAHVVLLRGPLDGVAELFLLVTGLAAGAATAVHLLVVRPLRRHRRDAP